MSTAGGPVPTAEIVQLVRKPLQALNTRELRILEEWFQATRKHAEEQLTRIHGELRIHHRHQAHAREIKVEAAGEYTCPLCGTRNALRNGTTCHRCGEDWADAPAISNAPA